MYCQFMRKGLCLIFIKIFSGLIVFPGGLRGFGLRRLSGRGQ